MDIILTVIPASQPIFLNPFPSLLPCPFPSSRKNESETEKMRWKSKPDSTRHFFHLPPARYDKTLTLGDLLRSRFVERTITSPSPDRWRWWE